MSSVRTTVALTMRQAVIRSPTRFEVVMGPRPKLQGPGELVVRTAACGICSGDLMEWYLERKVGTVLGHEVVGYAVEIGPNVEDVREGNLVFVHHHAPCLECRYCRAGDYVHCRVWRSSRLDPGGMAEYIRVPEVNARVDSFAINDLAPDVGVFIEPLACSVKALRRLGDGPREIGVVIGCGVMGLLNIAAAKAMGTRQVWAVEPQPDRRELARQFGADDVFTPEELQDRLEDSTEQGADFAIVGPGHPQVIAAATRYVRNGGVLILFTPTPQGAATSLDFSELYFREIRFVPSYSCGPQETRQAYQWLREGRVDVRPLVTHRFGLDQIQQAYDTAKQGGRVLKVLVTFDAEKQ